ncbi:MAG: Fur family transcriptional regulator [Pseudomonadota bacterium]
MTSKSVRDTHASRFEDLKSALKASGLRMTQQRIAVIKALSSSNDHPDANELHRRTREINADVSLATVYRTMTELEKNDVIHRLSFQGEPARFEAADAPHHDHIIDIETGDVIEFHSEKIERLQAEIARELGYNVVHHRLELYCSRREASDE